MSADLPERVPSAQTGKARRFSEVRATNLTDPKPDNAAAAHAADPTASTEAGAVFGAGLRVLGYERLTLLLDWEQGAATAFHVLPQVASLDAEAEYADLYTDEAGDGVLVRKVFDLTVAADGQIAFAITTAGVQMRFKVWADAADGDTNHTLKVVRHMDAY